MIKEGERMLIIHKLEKTHFSNSESIIIDYILQQGINIKNMTLKHIAEETYTSAPLLVRIAKKLGYSGWKDFSQAFVKELEYIYAPTMIDASIPFVISDDYMSISRNIAQLEMESIQDTLDLLKHDELYNALRILRGANEIDLYGVSDYVLLGEDFSYKMSLIKKRVNICKHTGDVNRQAYMSHTTHCAILISYSGETDFILRVARILKSKKVPIISLTSIADNDLSQLSDVTLHMSSKEMLHTKIGDFASSQSLKTLLDILYGCVFSFDYKRNLDDKIELAKLLDDRVSGFRLIDEEIYDK